jgi:hypothetical protein
MHLVVCTGLELGSNTVGGKQIEDFQEYNAGKIFRPKSEELAEVWKRIHKMQGHHSFS